MPRWKSVLSVNCAGDLVALGEEGPGLFGLAELEPANGDFAHLTQAIALVRRDSGVLQRPIEQGEFPLAL